MNVKFYATALLALALAGCNNDGPDNPLADGPVPMSFTADINSVATRATTNGFEDGDMVGIIPLKGDVVEGTQVNIAYTYNGSVFTANPPYYFQNQDEVTFNAYYPYQSTLDDPYTVEIDTRIDNQKTETVNGHSWRKNDYLFASDETTVGTPSISFTQAAGNPFTHVVSSVAIDFKAGTQDGVANLKPLTGYTLGDVVMDGTFNCSTGEVSPKSDATAETITVSGISCADNATEHQTTSLILLPQDVNGGKLSLTVNFNNTIYKADLTLDKLEAGKLHVFPVTIKNTELSVGTAEIKDWETQPEQSGDATLPLPTLGDKTADEAAIGDYYMADGSLLGKDSQLTPELKSKIAGIVFHVGHNENDKSDYTDTGIGEKQCHGYAVALKDATSEHCMWGVYGTLLDLGVEKDVYNNPGIDWSGYNYTQTIINYVGGEDKLNADEEPGYPATYHAVVAYEQAFPAPANSSGWFLPAIGQMWEVYQQRDLLTSVDDSSLKIDAYWSSTEYYREAAESAYSVNVFYNAIHYKTKGEEHCHVRAVLAF